MNKRKILLAASEMAPFAKVGGLADVVGTLPHYLNAIGCDARVVLPLYKPIKEQYAEQLHFIRWSTIRMGWRTLYTGLFRLEHDGVIVYFIDNEFYFGHDAVYLDYSFDMERFSFFQRAVLEAMGDPMDFVPDILQCNDWQTGMIPCLLDAHYRPEGHHLGVRTVFTIHNLKYQGIHGVENIRDLMDLSDEYMTEDRLIKDGVPNFMKAGIVFADRVTTVSPTYAQEICTPEFGEGLDGLLRQFADKTQGILNGIDTRTFNPETDPGIAQNFSVESRNPGKATCKKTLQKELHLEPRADVPLVAMISRLVDQKGLDLLIEELDALMELDVQLVVQGTGDSFYEWVLTEAAGRYRGRMTAVIAYDAALAHRIYAGADLFLMPSLFEPCGLSQMIAMRYGTVPLVRETGGLKDTIRPYNRFTGEGNGFTFTRPAPDDLLAALRSACTVFRDRKDAWEGLIREGMLGDYSWDRSAARYADLFERLAASVQS